jgi:hypothetical protein
MRHVSSQIELPENPLPSPEQHEQSVANRILEALCANGFPCALVVPDEDGNRDPG